MIHILQSFVLVPILIGTIRFNSLPTYARIIVIFYYISGITEVVAYSFAKTAGNNMVVYYYFVSVAAILLSVAYLKILRRAFAFILFLVPVTAFIEALVYGTDTFNSLSFTIFNACMIATCLYTYKEMVMGHVDLNLHALNGVFLFYSVSTMFVFLTARYFQQNEIGYLGIIFGIHAYLNAATYIASGCSIWILSKSYTSAS